MDPEPIVKAVPLSNDTVSSHINEMAGDTEQELCDILRYTDFVVQLDETTLSDNKALLMAYVKLARDEKLHEELLFACSLLIDSKGKSVFETLKSFMVKKEVPLTNIIACTTDGAPAMYGQYQGFIPHLKREMPAIFTIHCVFHRQHLIAKSMSTQLNATLQLVIKAVNKFKENLHKDRLFRQLCQKNEEHFE